MIFVSGNGCFEEASSIMALLTVFTSLLLYSLFSYHVCGSNGVHWSYNEDFESGPSNWKHSFPACGGRFQSPVDIRNAQDNCSLKPLVLVNYDKIIKNGIIVNNGHSDQVSVSGFEASLSGGCLGDDVYDFVQFHFHWGSDECLGSEHTVKGRRYAMEGHIVHVNRKYGKVEEAINYSDGMAVLGVFYEVGEYSSKRMKPVIQAVKEVAQKQINDAVNVTQSFTLRDMLPQDVTTFYCYKNGSLTTPACYESVTWTLLKNPVSISTEQMSNFRTLHYENGKPMVNNFRPVQALNGRTIYFHGIC